MNTRTKIRQAMRDNEKELLAHIRKYRLGVTAMLGKSWHNALNRLENAGQVRYDKKNHCYVAVKGARPVTGTVRS